MDGDGSHAPRFLPALLDAARSSDLVIGSRYVAGGGIQNRPPHRRALSAFASFYTRTLLRLARPVTRLGNRPPTVGAADSPHGTCHSA